MVIDLLSQPFADMLLEIFVVHIAGKDFLILIHAVNELVFERFVKNGGGVCFFMGPDVQAKYYNDELFWTRQDLSRDEVGKSKVRGRSGTLGTDR